jgi:hypothetical protein
MLAPKEISALFEVQINTLYNWRKTKPKLYAYLQNADYNSEINNEINVLLDFYSKTFRKSFTQEEIKYLIVSEYTLTSIENVNDFHKEFIKANYKNVPQQGDVVLNIYDKIKALNIVEKYILYKKIYKVRQNKEMHTICTVFQEFLQEGN